MWKDLKARILTAVVAIPFLLFFLWKGGLFFLILVLFIAGVFVIEAAGMVEASGGKIKAGVVMMALAVSLGTVHFAPDYATMVTSGAFMFVLAASLISPASGEEVINSGFYFIYPLLGFSHALLLRNLEKGFILIVYVLLATFLADTGAYFAGKLFGTHKVAPSISPGKSWEGVAGGVVFSYVAMIVAVRLLTHRWEYLWTLVFAVCITLLGLAGDLVESALKRRAGLKDSGTFFPGHGGVMDRLDSLMFNIPFAYYFFKFYGGVF